MKQQTFDAIIIGDGIAGLSVALCLARAKKKVLLLGKKGIQGAASWRAAGMLDPTFAHAADDLPWNLTLSAFKRYPHFLEQLKRKTRLPTGYKKTGMIYVALNSKEEKELRLRFRKQKKIGFNVRWMSRESLHTQMPWIHPKAVAAIDYPTVGRIQPSKLMTAMHQWARQEGVLVMNVSKKIRIQKENKTVQGVWHGKNYYASSVVVHATGVWASKTKSALSVPIVPVRGQVLIVQGKLKNPAQIVHSLKGVYIVPWGENEYLLGSTLEFGKRTPVVTESALKRLWQGALQLVPSLSKAKVKDSWAGLRPYSKTKQPLIGKTSTHGLYVANGFYRSGILIGYYVGELLSSFILSGKMPKMLKPFQPKF